MPRTVFDLVSPLPKFDTLPLVVDQVAAPGMGASRLLLLLPAVGAISVLLAGVAIAASSEPAVLDVLASRPVASLQIAVGLVIWAALFVVPASRAVASVGRRREISVHDGIVEIKERGPFATRTRSVPVASYRGIAHHIRASLSGLTHELVLVHGEPRNTVTIASADRISQETLDSAKALLALTELPARAIYERAASADAGTQLQTARA